MKKGMKKYLSVLLAALMSVSSMATFAAAEEDNGLRYHAHEIENDDENEAKERRVPAKTAKKEKLAAPAASSVMLMSNMTELEKVEMTPVPAETVWVGGVKLEMGEYLAVGADEGSTTKPSGGYAYYDENGTLTLNNFEYEGAGYLYDEYEYEDGDQDLYYVLIYSDTVLSIVLKGENSLCADSPYDYKNIDNTSIYLYTYGIATDSLDISGEPNSSLSLVAYDGINTINDISIANSNVTIYAEGDDGLDTYGKLSIDNSNIEIISEDDSIAYASQVTIENNSVITLNAGYSGMYDVGNVNVRGKSTVTINADVDGIYADNGDVTIEDSTVNINADEKGIKVYDDVFISGDSSEITITSDYSAISCSEVILDNSLELLYPRDGDYSAPAIYIAAAVDHVCTANDSWYSDISGHWQVCAAPNCPIPKSVEFGMNYDEHNFNCDNICESCGVECSNLIVGNHYLPDGEYLASNGTVSQSTQPTSGGYAHYEKGTLTLNNFECDTEDCAITCDGDLTIELEGNNILTVRDAAAVSIAGDLTITGLGTLAIDSENYALYTAENASGNTSVPLLMNESNDFAEQEEENTYNIIIDGAKIISSSAWGICAEGNFTITDSTANFYSAEADTIYVSGTVSVTNSTLNLTTDCYYTDYAGIYADAVEITDSTVTISSKCNGIFVDPMYTGIEPMNETSVETSDETVSNTPDIIITRSNVTIDAAYYILRSERGITLNDCELPEGMEIAVVEDEYYYSSEPAMLLTAASEGSNEPEAEFEYPIYTVVDANGEAVHHLVITYNKPTDEPETEDTTSPVPNLNLTGIRYTENGKTKILPSAFGSRRTFTFTPAEGYCVADVLVNGKSVGAVEKYTVVTVPGITVEVIYEEIEG